MSVDNVVQENSWEFDNEVTDCFDDMLQRSIPQYDLMRELTHRIGEHFVNDGGTIVDIGCSRGQALRPFVESHGTSCKYLGTDVSDSMIEAAKMNFEDAPTVSIEKYDARFGIPILPCSASLVLCVLSIQFTPIEYRNRIMSYVYDALKPGGCMILVEKVLGENALSDDILVGEYYRMKSDNAYTQEQIQKKRKSLEGVLVPVTAKWNEDMLKNAGFSTVERFWQCLNFAGWMAVKNG